MRFAFFALPFIYHTVRYRTGYSAKYLLPSLPTSTVLTNSNPDLTRTTQTLNAFCPTLSYSPTSTDTVLDCPTFCNEPSTSTSTVQIGDIWYENMVREYEFTRPPGVASVPTVSSYRTVVATPDSDE